MCLIVFKKKNYRILFLGIRLMKRSIKLPTEFKLNRPSIFMIVNGNLIMFYGRLSKIKAPALVHDEL